MVQIYYTIWLITNMKKNNVDINAVRDMHRAGFLTEAEEGYLSILRKNPREIDALHSLGILYAQRENFTDAIKYLQTAIQFQPNNPTLQLHLANVYKIQGLFSQAAQILQNTINENPGYAPAYNNLGSVYFAQEKLRDAIQAYRHAITKQPDYIDAYYNLGLTLAKQKNFADAIDTFNDLLKRAPEHFAARFHLACILMQQDQVTDAIKNFLIIEEAQPHHFETQTNLATCYLKKGALNEAKIHYYNALELKPEDTQILFNLGVINMQQGHIDLAIQNYQRVIQINPNLFAAHNNLGVAFLAKQHAAFALHHFEEALRLQPKNEAINYTVKMLSKHQHLLSAPPDYVKSLFDAYADHYEPHLLNALNYQVPDLLHKALAHSTRLKPNSLDILDLGCGTGLCGVVFKSYAKTLTGIDLSEKMLEVAAQKNIYQQLADQDISQFLSTKNESYDLIIAGDVLVYIGDLRKVFDDVNHALRPQGLFAFNTEICTEKEFQMNQSGRFAHSKEYLEQLAKEHHFVIKYFDVVVTRMQNNEPVQGYLYVLQNTR